MDVQPQSTTIPLDVAEEPDNEDKKKWKHRCKNIFLGIVWLAVTGVMAWYMSIILVQFFYQTPGSTVTYTTRDGENLPSVTICNWNQIIDDVYTPDTNLTMVECYKWSIEDVCPPGTFQYTQVPTDYGVFNCYLFNSDTENPITSEVTGFAGSYSALFEIVLPIYPPAEQFAYRAGLQVSFSEIGVVPDVYNEIRFAPPGVDSFYGVRLVETTYKNETVEANQGPFTSYETVYSTIALINQPTINGTGLVAVSFSFQTLSVLIIEYDKTYSQANFFGDFAGMLGTLMGLDTIKVAASIPVFLLAVKKRRPGDIGDHFNG
jgi:hypothetical protein